MGSWDRVRWTEAGQIAELLGWERGLGADAHAKPEDYCAALRRAGRLHDAVFFLSQALPRYETVAWAARSVRDLTPKGPHSGPEIEALKTTLLWVQDPSEARRRAAWDAAARMPRHSPERLVALAAFFSGGSIAPPDCPPVPAPREAAGRLAAGAVLVAAIRTRDPTAAMIAALDTGTEIAERGLDAAA